MSPYTTIPSQFPYDATDQWCHLGAKYHHRLIRKYYKLHRRKVSTGGWYFSELPLFYQILLDAPIFKYSGFTKSILDLVRTGGGDVIFVVVLLIIMKTRKTGIMVSLFSICFFLFITTRLFLIVKNIKISYF